MTNVGYATLSIIPSMQGFSGLVEREMAPQLAQAGKTAGVTAGREVGKGISAGVKEHAPTTSGVFGNIEKGAAVAGVGAGRRFGTALHETLGEYTKTIGATMVGFFAYEKVKEFLTGVVEESRKAAANERITAAIIKSTGGAAHVTAEQVGELTDALSKKTGIDREQIASSENVLLTFKGVRNEVGKGNDVFNQASQAILDISTVMAGTGGGDGGNSFSGAARQLGKALNDPVKGLTALTRVGVTFTQQQKDQIKALVDSGHTLDAQKIILHEIQSEYGGAAAASGDAISKMSASFHIFEAELGQKVLPGLEHMASGVTQDVIPALDALSSGVIDLAKGWGSLPGPIKAATEAWIAYTVAQKLGITTSVASSVSRVGLAFSGLSQRVSLARYEFIRAREGQVLMTNGLVSGFVPGVGRASAALTGLKAGALGAGGALRRGLGGALGLVGGPWGAAFIAGTAIITHFWQAHEEAAQHVKDLTDSLNTNTGAMTKNTAETVYNELVKNGTARAYKAMGGSLGDLTAAALGNADATAKVNAVLDAHTAALRANASADKQGIQVKQTAGHASDEIRAAIGGETDSVKKSRAAWKDHNAALKGAAEAIKGATQETKGQARENADAAGSFKSMAARIRDARNAVRELMVAENKRRAANLQNKQDRLSLVEQMQATADEARKGARTLDINTKAGQANRQALYDLANQWNNSSAAVRNAKGSYMALRKQFVDDAVAMGDTKAEARKLADQILQVPKHAPIQVDTPGMAAALANLAALRQEVADSQNLAVYVQAHYAQDPRLKNGNNASGTDFWRGGPTWVGENGAELVNLPRGSQVIPHDKATTASRGPQRIVLDFGAGRALTGWIQDEVNSNAAYQRTTGSRR